MQAKHYLVRYLSERFLLFPIIIQGFISYNVAMSHIFHFKPYFLSLYKIKLCSFYGSMNTLGEIAKISINSDVLLL